jgi:alkylation response protein AidB-like acyl-CoA dehydrogenase
MNGLLNKAHDNWRAKVREFAEKEIKPIIGEYDRKGIFPTELIKKMGKDLRVFGMHVPKEYGGQGTDTLSYIITVEELARVNSSVAATLAAHNSLGMGPLFMFGSEEQKTVYLPKLSTGESLWAMGLTEVNAGSDAKAVETSASLQNEHWKVNGNKLYITNAASELSKGITIAARTGEISGKPEFSAILVPYPLPGFTREPMQDKLVWRAADNGKLHFKNVMVPEENLLGKRGDGLKILLKTIDSGRLSIAAMGVGLAQGAFEMAREHALNRKQFGQPIANLQAISFKLADMAVKIENARNTLYNACWMKDQGIEYGKNAAMAKLYASEIAKEVADEAVQIFAGAGLLESNPVAQFYRDQRLLQIGEGTSEILRLVIGRSVLKEV